MSHGVMGTKRSLWIVVTLAITAMKFDANDAKKFNHGISARVADRILANMTAQGAAESNDD